MDLLEGMQRILPSARVRAADLADRVQIAVSLVAAATSEPACEDCRLFHVAHSVPAQGAMKTAGYRHP
eukprot:COSAG03_NODE_19505_length_335_cov_0.872881_1_plen_67_part_01